MTAEKTKKNLRELIWMQHKGFNAEPTVRLQRRTTSLCKNTKRHGAAKAPQLFAFIQGREKTW